MKNIFNIYYHQKLVLLFILFLIYSNPLAAQNITPPTCYGGNRLMKEFIKEEMVYPAKAIAEKTEGEVELSYIVLPDGSISDLKVSRSVSPEIDHEAIRIFNKILWNPAKELGKPIAYLTTFKLKFNINKYLKTCKARGYDQIEYPYQPIDTTDIVYAYKKVDQMPIPVFEKGMSFAKFIRDNLKYPEAAFKQNIAGRVKLKFVVEPSGRISNILIIESLGGGCTEEAIRVVKLIWWNPGILDEIAVRTCMELEIAFNIAGQTVGGKIPTPGQVH